MHKNHIDPAAVRAALLGWYDTHGRTLPWRSKTPGAVADPYKVWLSEIMLQQTTVAVVSDYYARFLARWPDVQALAAAPLDDVLHAWAGLGYYARARNLHACAQKVATEHGGVFPVGEKALLSLPGIGPYTAAALMAIAHNRPANVVDGNVERVMARLHKVKTPLPAAKKELTALAARYVTKARCADWPQALMDLSALICRPKNPACALCPIHTFCAAGQNDDAATYPRRAAKKPKPVRHGAAFILRKGAFVYLQKRPAKGLLGGMSEVPGTDWQSEKINQAGLCALAPVPANWENIGTVRHVFTHFALKLVVFTAPAPTSFQPADGWWADVRRLDEEALPSLMRKVLALGHHSKGDGDGDGQ